MAQISCKSVLWYARPHYSSPNCPTQSIGEWIGTTAPRPHGQSYAPRADTQLMRSAEKKQRFLASLHRGSVKAENC